MHGGRGGGISNTRSKRGPLCAPRQRAGSASPCAHCCCDAGGVADTTAAGPSAFTGVATTTSPAPDPMVMEWLSELRPGCGCWVVVPRLQLPRSSQAIVEHAPRGRAHCPTAGWRPPRGSWSGCSTWADLGSRAAADRWRPCSHAPLLRTQEFVSAIGDALQPPATPSASRWGSLARCESWRGSRHQMRRPAPQLLML